MAFVTDGQVHYSGIQNELDTIDAINDLNLFEQPVVHLGGTGHTADAVGGANLSIKLKKSIKTGSFDYVNSTRLAKGIIHHFGDFLDYVSELRQLSVPERRSSVDELRERFADECDDCLDNMSSEEIIEILQDTMIDHHSDIDYMVVSDQSTNKIYMYSPDNHPVVGYLKRGLDVMLVSSGRARSSRQICFVNDDGSLIQTGLRIRVTSNNGVNAFLGLGSNKNSSVVVKIQQDSVDKMLAAVSPDCYSV